MISEEKKSRGERCILRGKMMDPFERQSSIRARASEGAIGFQCNGDPGIVLTRGQDLEERFFKGMKKEYQMWKNLL